MPMSCPVAFTEGGPRKAQAWGPGVVVQPLAPDFLASDHAKSGQGAVQFGDAAAEIAGRPNPGP